MPSPPSRPPPEPRATSSPAGRELRPRRWTPGPGPAATTSVRTRLLLTLLALVLAAGCGSTAPPAPIPEPGTAGPLPEDRPYLVSPLEGWDGGATAEQQRLLAAGREALEGGDATLARDRADEAAGADGATAFPPAAVLAAEADLAERRPGAAVARLEPLADAHPTYTALHLVLGRAAEETGDLVAAFAAFQRLAGVSLLAFDRAEELRPRVAEILGHRVEEAVDRRDMETAEELLERLRAWAPETEPAFRAAALLARARDDRGAELAAVRELASRQPEDLALAQRWAELELEVGRPKTGLDVFQRLAARHPDDAELAERLAYAKFRWRVAQMPPRVTEAASKTELERGDLAVLLYWLLPRVRSERPASARIASDILDDPRREEIARVANLGLMELDLSLHRFDPGRPATRGDALDALLRVLVTFGRAPCAAGVDDGGQRQPAERLCELALACGLVRADELCAPREPLSGAAAVELVRRTLDDLERLRSAR